ncbi:MAG: ABC transporter ATP-binding protein, partial [Clostridia bacterium]|nr:ABC transporter ATP-binding protein [Clostridia bacterium]
MRKVLSYLKPYSLRIALELTVKMGGSMIELVLPAILAHLIDEVAPTKNIPITILWGFVMLVCATLAWLGNVTANRMAARISSWVARNIRHDLFAKITYLSSHKTDEFTIPSLISRLSSDTYNIQQFVGMIQRMGVRAPILMIGGIIMTLTLDPVLTLVLIAMMPLLSIVIYLRVKKGFPLFRKLQEAQDEMVRKVRENVTGVRVIKALSKTGYERERFDEVNKNVVAKETHANIIMMLTGPLLDFFMNIGLIFIILVGAYRVSHQLTQIGVITAFFSYLTTILNAMMSISRIFTMYTRAAASGERIAEVLDTEDELFVEPDLPAIQTDAHIVFDHVSFSYNKVRDNVSDINFELKKGQMLGIIGPTGSGKTTLVQLLLRFYDVDKGHIYINGR